ncbi:hypothetical protein [Halobellus captivus]|uniref:hypothetical protein n=1 Tax=Halobellus captivus TaxID=2592614 RepID=UPI0011A396A4|nr:hypothetical protein [Halobellus captivus]
MNGTNVVEGDGAIERGSDGRATTQVSAHRSSPDRVVFTESGNCDGWISIDAELSTPLER